jgi:hypothetical protein
MEPGRRLSAPAEGAGRAAVPCSPAALSVERGVYQGAVRWLCRGEAARPSDRLTDPEVGALVVQLREFLFSPPSDRRCAP